MTYKPSWYRLAESLIGTKEVPGPASNNIIVGWLVKLGAAWRSDDVPWCGTFTGYCLKTSGVKIPANFAWAKAWATWGTERTRDNLSYGTVLVFTRDGGGHVGFYAGEDDTHYHVLGGNQSDAVNISSMPKARCIGSRWPSGVPFTGGPVLLSPSGAPLSTSEA